MAKKPTVAHSGPEVRTSRVLQLCSLRYCLSSVLGGLSTDVGISPNILCFAEQLQAPTVFF